MGSKEKIYVSEKKVGEGNSGGVKFGTVQRSHIVHGEYKEDVAMKFNCEGTPEAIKRNTDCEILIMKKISMKKIIGQDGVPVHHPNVIEYKGWGELTEGMVPNWATVDIVGTPFIIMEQLETYKGSLANQYLLGDGSDESAKYFPQIAIGAAKGLQHIHECGVIHFDFDLRNVLLGLDNGKLVAKVCDFGLSKLADKNGNAECPFPPTSYDTENNIIVPNDNSAPENVFHLKSDVWSFGYFLLQLMFPSTDKYLMNYNITGALETDGINNGILQLMALKRQRNGGEKIIEKVQAHYKCTLSKKLKGIITHCLATDQEERPSMANVVGRLERLTIVDFKLKYDAKSKEALKKELLKRKFESNINDVYPNPYEKLIPKEYLESSYGKLIKKEYRDGALISTGKKYIVKEGTKEIKSEQFKNRNDLSAVLLPPKLVKIGDEAFSGCKNLVRVSIPKSVRKIRRSAFKDCEKLEELYLENGSLVEIGDEAFSGCKNLVRVVIPRSVEIIGSRAFENCEKLAQLELDNGLKEIGSNAFLGCRNLDKVPKVQAKQNNFRLHARENKIYWC